MSTRSRRHSVKADTSRHGALFGAGLLAGGSAMAYGTWLVVANAVETRPLNFVVFFVGLALVHDLVVAPVALLVGTRLRRRLPTVARAAVAGAVVASAIVAAFVVPFVLDRAAKVGGNPTILPRNPLVGVAIVLGGVWLIAGVVVLRRLLAEDRA